MIPHVKICGIGRPEDARLAVELGASALGFVFWPSSPRAIAARRAREIVAALPAFVTTVGVFVNQRQEEVLTTAREAGLGAIQLHGDEDASAYAGCGFQVIKALPVGERFTVADLDAIPRDVTVLLDAHDPERRGGTGRRIDWSVAAEAARVRPVILAGGLKPENVQQAVEDVRPYAIDISSGVESAPGVKDPGRLRALFAALTS